MSVLAELKRRKVIKVGGAYLVVAWLVVQAASIGFPAFEAPAWTLRVFIFVVMLGFPISLMFAWAFDVTPDGVTAAPSSRASAGVFLVAAALAALAVVWYFKGQPSYREGDIPLSEGPSIAVLPFANLSGDPQQEYFSDGMTEELLNVLARLTKLKVVARTSVFEFKGKGGDVREIGRRLGVTHIVEGSVRREGKHVRVTAQLVRVADGFHIWSDSFDRELESVITLQDDIARQIAEQLETKLGLAEAPSARAAIDFWAFDEYLKGRTLYRQRKDLPEAIAHLQAAVKRDPEFGAGWASLSLAHESARWYTTPEQRAVLGNALGIMRTAAERAAELDPDAALTLHAQGNVRRGQARYAEAEQLYLRAMEADPTYPDVREDYAELLNNVGRHEDSLVAARELVQLEPFVANFWRRIADVGVSLDRRTLVEEARDRMREIDPSYRGGILADFYFEFWQGRIEPAREALAEAVRLSPTAAAPVVELFQWSERDASIDDAHARRVIVGGLPEYAPFAAHRGDADIYFAAYEDQLTHYPYYFRYALPVTAPLLGDPRGKEMLRRYGFVAYWREKGWPAYCRPLDDDDFECGPEVKELRMTE
jgi:TolB-like protein